MVLADFNRPILPPAVDLEVAPVDRIEFDDERKGRVSDVLTAIKQPWKYSMEYLEERVNANLDAYTEVLFGTATAKLCSAFGFDAGQLTPEGACLLFPGGSDSVTYHARNLETGVFIHTVSFSSDWFDHATDIPRVLKALNLSPERLRVVPREEMTRPRTPRIACKGLGAEFNHASQDRGGAGWASGHHQERQHHLRRVDPARNSWHRCGRGTVKARERSVAAPWQSVTFCRLPLISAMGGDQERTDNRGSRGAPTIVLNRLHDGRQSGLSGDLGDFAGLVGAGDGAGGWPKRLPAVSETVRRGHAYPPGAKPQGRGEERRFSGSSMRMS